MLSSYSYTMMMRIGFLLYRESLRAEAVGVRRSGSQLNDLWLYDVERRSWTIPICGGTPPAPREMHCCTTIKHYLVVAGGVDGSQRFHDIHVLDTNRMVRLEMRLFAQTPCWRAAALKPGTSHQPPPDISRRTDHEPPDGIQVWELLDDGAEYTAIMPWRSRAQYNCFLNGRLFRLKPNRNEVIDELEIVDFSLPDDLEELQRARNRKEENEDTIEISDVRLSLTIISPRTLYPIDPSPVPLPRQPAQPHPVDCL